MPDFDRSLLESYLDNDTVLKVIEHLDSYSIINFLHAFPRFKDLAVIVTDHHKPQPLFFRIDVVERVRITDYTESRPVEILDGGPDNRLLAKSNLRAQRLVTNRPIRLFEFSWMDTEEYMDSILPVIPSQEKLSVDQPFYFNATSFVFLCPNYYRDVRPMDALTRRLDEFTDAKWHVGWSPYLNDECVIMNKSLSLPVTELRLIKNLCLKDVPVLENLHLPELERLSLTYYETRAPVVRGIIAAKLTKLIVHYSHHVPQFSEMSVATEEPGEDEEHSSERDDLLVSNYDPHGFYYGPDFEELDDLKVFELAHIGSMTKGTRTLESVRDQRINDFSFLTQFQIVHLFGVPDSFFHSADLSNMWKLRWDISHQPQLDTAILAPCLGDLSLVVRRDGIRVPSLNIEGDQIRWKSHWHIMILGLNTNTSDLWSSDCDGHFACSGVCIYSSPLNLKRDPLSVMELGHSDWSRVLSLVNMNDRADRRKPTMETIELIGFKMPFLSHQHGLDVQERRFWGSYQAKKFIIRPVIDIQSGGELELNLGAVFLCNGICRPEAGQFSLGYLGRAAVNPKANIKNLQFVVSPVLVNRDNIVRGIRNRLEVCYPHHIGHLLTGMPSEASRTFSISLGEEVSSFCLLNARRMPPVVLSSKLCDFETISIDLDNIIEPDTPLVGRLRPGRDMECDWFLYGETTS